MRNKVMETVVSALNDIGMAIGIPAALLIGYLFLSVKDLKNRIDKLEDERENDKKAHNEEMSKIYDKLNTVAQDVAYIKGKLEDGK